MNEDPPANLEDAFTALMAACDDALAVGDATPLLGVAGALPELKPRLEKNLACAQLVRQVLRTCPTLPIGAPLGSLAAIPWTRLGRFQIRRELGRGGCGIVFLAHDPLLNRDVAIKVARADSVVSAGARERFHCEARAASALDHPNLVPVYEAGEEGPVSFIVSAYCPGITLAEWLKKQTDPVPVQDAAAFIATLARAVQHAHERGVLHRDLKPANVLLQMENGEWRMENEDRSASAFSILHSQFSIPKITDFGLAKEMADEMSDPDSPGPTRTGAILGTPCYMAPEQAGGKSKDVTPAADVYALGAILYELLTSRPPFRGETDLDTLLQVRLADPIPPSRLRPRVPRDLETICLKCLQKEPAKRYRSAAALAEDLQRFRAGETILARPVGKIEKARRWCRRNPVLAAMSGLATAALVAVAVGSVVFAFQESRHARDLGDALRTAEEHRREVEYQRAKNDLDRGLILCEEGDVRRGLLWLARGLESAPADAVDLRRVLRANLGAWSSQLGCLPRLVLEHGETVLTVAPSPDGNTLATGGGDGTVRFWDAATGNPIGIPLAHPRGVHSLAFNRDGSRLITGAADGVIRIWDTATGKVRLERAAHRGTVSAVAFSPTGETFVSGGWDNIAQVWNAETGEPLGDPLFHSGPVTAFAFNRMGDLLVTGSVDRWARVWNPITGKSGGPSFEHPDSVWAVALSDDGKTLLTGCSDEFVRVWNVETGKRSPIMLQHQASIRSVACSSDGRYWLTGSSDRTCRLWDSATGKLVGTPLAHLGVVSSVAFHPTRNLILSGSWDGTARLWSLPDRGAMGVKRDHPGWVQCVAFSPDGRFAATACEDHLGRVWEVDSEKAPVLLRGHDGPVQHVSFSSDGKWVVTGSADGSVRLWDAISGEEIRRYPGHAGAIVFAVLSPDLRYLATVGTDRTCCLWNVATPNSVEKRLLGNVGETTDVAFSPDSRSVLTGCKDKTAVLWDTATGERLKTFQTLESVVAVAFAPNGKTIATGGVDGLTCLWDVDSGKQVGEPLRHTAAIRTVAFSPDGARVVTASFDQTARVWSAQTGEAISPPLAHRARVRTACFAPDSARVLTVSFDHTARVWDAITGKPIGPTLMHDNWVVTGAFRCDGETVLTGSTDKTARFWRVSPAVDDEPARLRLWVEVLTIMELDSQGEAHALEAQAWQSRVHELGELGGPPR